MSKIFFTADNHFGHANIIKFENRPYKSVVDMDMDMVYRWNYVVKPEDTVYIIGDFSFAPIQGVKEILSKLNGHKHLIIGNHDYHAAKLGNYFESISQYKEIKLEVPWENEPIDVVLFHYPIFEWNKRYHGAIHIYGHVHSMINQRDIEAIMPKPKEGMYNAGVDLNDYAPVELHNLIENNKKWIKNTFYINKKMLDKLY